MAETPVYGLRTPDPNDVPDVPSDMQNLAEDVEGELERIDASAQSLADRVTALESGVGGAGWVVIGSGSAPAGHSFTIDLTGGGKFPSPPLWNQVEIHMRIDLTEEDLVVARINSDAAAIYRSSGYSVDGGGVLEQPWHYDANTVWPIARTATAGTNMIHLRLFTTDVNPGLHEFLSTFSRESASSSVNQIGHAHGSTTAGRTLTSLYIAGNAATDIVNCWWTATGLRLAHPS